MGKWYVGSSGSTDSGTDDCPAAALDNTRTGSVAHCHAPAPTALHEAAPDAAHDATTVPNWASGAVTVAGATEATTPHATEHNVDTVEVAVATAEAANWNKDDPAPRLGKKSKYPWVKSKQARC